MFVVMVAENTGLNIRRAAFSAATAPVSPSRRARKSACSPTTIASSTTMPNVMISAKSEIMLIVMPDIYISEIAASIETGMPIATQTAVRAFKNKNRSSSTRAKPCAPFSIRIFRRPVIISARVLIMSTLTPSGKVDRISAATSSTERCRPMASPDADRTTEI